MEDANQRQYLIQLTEVLGAAARMSALLDSSELTGAHVAAALVERPGVAALLGVTGQRPSEVVRGQVLRDVAAGLAASGTANRRDIHVVQGRSSSFKEPTEILTRCLSEGVFARSETVQGAEIRLLRCLLREDPEARSALAEVGIDVDKAVRTLATVDQ